MSVQYVINESGDRVSVILPLAEYQALLALAVREEDETAYLLKSPENARILRQRLADIRQDQNIQERELLPDES